MSITRDAILEILAFLFPPVCLACRRVEGTRSQPLCLCNRCRDRLEILRQPADHSRPVADSSLEGILSRWSYETPLDCVIHGLKFGRMEFLGIDLADGLHHLLEEADAEIHMVVPIPLHWHRRLVRGYNQAEAIAKPLATSLGLPLVKAIRRLRVTRPQATLSRHERERNLRSAFAPAPRQCAKIVGRRLLLVDDVVTTGATLEAAARCLKNHGAHSVLALTAGRTPAGGVHRGGWS